MVVEKGALVGEMWEIVDFILSGGEKYLLLLSNLKMLHFKN